MFIGCVRCQVASTAFDKSFVLARKLKLKTQQNLKADHELSRKLAFLHFQHFFWLLLANDQCNVDQW